MFYQSGVKSYRVPGYYKAAEKRLVGVILRPDTWAANTVYYRRSDDDYNIVIPTVFDGKYRYVKVPGKSAATEPVWDEDQGDETLDGTLGLIWGVGDYNFMPPDETIASVTVTADNGLTITGLSYTGTNFSFMISIVPAGVESFTVTCAVTKSNGEIIPIELVFKVG